MCSAQGPISYDFIKLPKERKRGLCSDFPLAAIKLFAAMVHYGSALNPQSSLLAAYWGGAAIVKEAERSGFLRGR